MGETALFDLLRSHRRHRHVSFFVVLPMRVDWILSLLHLCDEFDLDGNVPRERARPNSRARVHATLLEDAVEKVGAAVQYFGVLRVPVGRVDEADELDDAYDTVEILQVRLQRADQPEPDRLRHRRRLCGRVINANLARVQRRHVLLEGDVAGEKDEVAGADEGGVARQRRRHRRQLIPELGDSHVRLAIHAVGVGKKLAGESFSQGYIQQHP